MISPPAAKMRARAFSVTRRAHNLIFGTFNKRSSFVTVPTTTTVFSVLPLAFNKRATLCNDIGGKFVRLINRRFKTILLNFLYVRLYKKRYSCKLKRKIKRKKIIRKFRLVRGLKAVAMVSRFRESNYATQNTCVVHCD